MLFGAASGEDDGGAPLVRRSGSAGRRERPRGCLKIGGGYAGEPFHLCGPVAGGHAADVVEAVGPLGHIVAVNPALGQHDVEQRVRQREVGPRRRLQVQIRLAGRGRRPRVDDDQRAAALLLFGQIAGEGRHRLGHVRAHEQQRVGPPDVVDRERQAAVHAEGRIPAAAAEDMQNRPL